MAEITSLQHWAVGGLLPDLTRRPDITRRLGRDRRAWSTTGWSASRTPSTPGCGNFLDIAAADPPQRYLVLDAGERRIAVLRARSPASRWLRFAGGPDPVQVLAPSRAPVQP